MPTTFSQARKQPANAEYRYWLGRAQFEAKQYQDAIKNLNEAAKLDDKLPNVFVHLALAYDAAGDRKNAAESLRRAIKDAERRMRMQSSDARTHYEEVRDRSRVELKTVEAKLKPLLPRLEALLRQHRDGMPDTA